MEKTFKTMTYGVAPLQVNPDADKLFPKGVEVKAKVDLDTGEVKFFIDDFNLKRLQNEMKN